MADLHALELALTLDPSTPEPVLALIREHMEPYDWDAEDADAEYTEEGEYIHPPLKVLAYHGPAHRVGGECTADLTRTPAGWTLTARQEIHTETLPDVEQFLEALTPHLTTPGAPLGTLRFYENTDPEPITPDASGAVRLS
ncbi:hypothetical protein [Streptomyces sp. NPDC047976]|uniref:hypothetical protein n=1 Tax=unclassified Streptomyces TaxID=2593676 RepID=UPI00343304EE